MNRQLPARVYWVRRALVLVVLLILALALIAVARTLTGDGQSESAEVTPTPTPSSNLPGGIGDCDPAKLGLAIAATAPSYEAGVSPGFAVTITNTDTISCLVDAGEANRELVVTSGSDRIWSSRDCAAEDPEDRTLLLTPGASDTQQVAWNLLRSRPGCPGELPDPDPGTYVMSVSVGSATAAQTSFVLDAPPPPPAPVVPTPSVEPTQT